MSKENPPGFLSKVARFVRKPMTNWTDLDQPEPDKSTDYSKALLKEMIERKRRNDFVRKREFDQLRKMRRTGTTIPSSLEPPSFFQSSLPSNPLERENTLRKIDEIEAQMSKQWWKSKSPTGTGSEPPDAAAMTRALAKTEMQALGESEAAATGASAAAPAASTQASAIAADDGWPTIPPTVPDPLLGTDRWRDDEPGMPGPAAEPGFVHDPELEEPAILFANGDYEGAEASLSALLAPGAPGVERPSIWLALFDLYRATGQHARFESIALDFAARFGRSEPVWFTLTDPRDSAFADAAAPAKAAPATRAFGWSAPELLTAKTITTLEATLAKGPLQPWRFNWGKLADIEPDAKLPLLRLFEQWSSQAVRLRFNEVEQLEQVLATLAPSGDASADPVGWRLRLELLRVMQRADDFDRLALDYCITYEVSPPSWIDPACTIVQGQEEPAALSPTTAATGPDSAVHDDSYPVIVTAQEPVAPLPTVRSAMAELSGRLVGDAGERLVEVDRRHPGVKSLTVRCDALARVDFSAAGSVLNWAAARQADGCQVEFSQLQRLVACFFNVVGISEYARVSVRHN